MILNNANLNNGNIPPQIVDNAQNDKDYLGTILYLHYPNYENHSKNTFSGVVGDIWDKSYLSEIKLPVGHSAIILIDKFGNTKYYEYGRYNNKKNK